MEGRGQARGRGAGEVVRSQGSQESRIKQTRDKILFVFFFYFLLKKTFF